MASLSLILTAVVLAAAPSQEPAPRQPLGRQPADGQPVGQQPADGQTVVTGNRALLYLTTLVEKAERNARLSFTKSSAERARELIEGVDEGSSLELRSIALMTLGCARSRRDLTMLESAVAGGKLSVRRAGVLALGEVGEWGFDPLRTLADQDVIGLEEVLILALIRAGEQGVAEANELVVQLATRDDSLGRAASVLQGLAHGEDPPDVLPALDFYYELRWKAAREFGFVDGFRWRQLLLADLKQDDEFLDRFILTAARILDPDPVDDHLVEMVLAGGRPGALRASAAVMPEILARLYNGGEWEPASVEEWTIIIDELTDRRLERQAIDLVQGAFAHGDPELQAKAGLLLFRAGADIRWHWVADRISAGSGELRIALLEAAGDRQDPERISDLLAILRRRPDLDIQGAITVALARLGHESAGDHMQDLITGGPSLERDEMLVSLSHTSHDLRMLPYIDKALRRQDLTLDLRLQLQLGYAIGGRHHDRRVLRDWLAQTEGPHPLRSLAVRGLGQTADADDLLLLDDMFPDERDMDLNVELALVLLKYREPVSLELLTSALWEDSWNRSVLAGGLLVRATSIYDLINDLEAPPRSAGDQDLRRVGFAIGQWGGLQAVEVLARNHNERHPALQGAFLGALSIRTH